MHAVKGNLANTVCKRKHQHIASVPVLGRPCMLFSNFDSFLWGQGVGVMDFFPPPAQCHPDPKPRGGSLSDRDVCFLARQTGPSCVPDNGPCRGTNVYTHLQLYMIYTLTPPHSFCEKTGPQIFHRIWSFSILVQAHTHYAQGVWMGGGAGKAIWRLILFQSILSSCADNVPEPLYGARLLLVQKAPCLQHMSTFDKALLFPPTIFCCSDLWNEGANKLAFYVYLCVGVTEGG